MSDAAVKVDPEFYNRRLLETDGMVRTNNHGEQLSSRSAGIGMSRRGMMLEDDRPDLPDYLVRQHSLLGLYLSLNPGDEADAEAIWGFPYNKRMTIASVSIFVPLFLALMVTGSWLWKVLVIDAVTVAAMLGMRFALHTVPDLEMTVQGYTLAVWPHGTAGLVGLMGIIWLVAAIISGTGWSTLWLCITSLLVLASAEAALRGAMWHFRWWVPAERFPFLKPWGETPTTARRTQHPRGSSYAPPRPVPAPPVEEPSAEPFLGRGGGSGGALGASFSERVELNRNLNGDLESGDTGLDSTMGNGIDLGESGLAVTAAQEEEEAAELLQELGRGLGGGGGGGAGGTKTFGDGDLSESV